MRAVVITEPGGPEALRIREVPDPRPSTGEVLVQVAATAVNRADVLQRQGRYDPPPGASPYPGLECSGTIVELGDGVTGWDVGQQVCALLAGGGYAELVAAPAGQLLPVPRGIDLATAGCLPEVTCTVWSMVFERGGLQPGESFLVHGGTSGIGTMAIQLAHRHGATVLTTAGSDAKLQVCRELGADQAINYRTDDFVERVRSGTDGRGVDVILDNIGAKYLPRNVTALATGGRLVVLGLQGGITGELNLGMLLAKRATVTAASLRARSTAEKAAVVAATEAQVWPALESGQVRPVIDRTFELADIVAAHQRMESSEHIGKLLVRVGD